MACQWLIQCIVACSLQPSSAGPFNWDLHVLKAAPVFEYVIECMECDVITEAGWIQWVHVMSDYNMQIRVKTSKWPSLQHWKLAALTVRDICMLLMHDKHVGSQPCTLHHVCWPHSQTNQMRPRVKREMGGVSVGFDCKTDVPKVRLAPQWRQMPWWAADRSVHHIYQNLSAKLNIHYAITPGFWHEMVSRLTLD